MITSPSNTPSPSPAVENKLTELQARHKALTHELSRLYTPTAPHPLERIPGIGSLIRIWRWLHITSEVQKRQALLNWLILEEAELLTVDHQQIGLINHAIGLLENGLAGIGTHISQIDQALGALQHVGETLGANLHEFDSTLAEMQTFQTGLGDHLSQITESVGQLQGALHDTGTHFEQVEAHMQQLEQAQVGIWSYLGPATSSLTRVERLHNEFSAQTEQQTRSLAQTLADIQAANETLAQRVQVMTDELAHIRDTAHQGQPPG